MQIHDYTDSQNFKYSVIVVNNVVSNFDPFSYDNFQINEDGNKKYGKNIH